MKKKRINSRYILLILFLFVSIGFAYLSSNLNLIGSFAFRSSSWDIHFEDILVDEELSFDDAVEPTLNQNRDTISMNLNFSKPGDRLVFYVDVVNNGSFDAKLDSINITNNLSSENNKLLDLSVKYLDGITVQENDILLAHNRKVLMISAEYSTNIDVSDLPSSVVNYTAEVNLNYIHLKDYSPSSSMFRMSSHFKGLVKYLITNDSSHLVDPDNFQHVNGVFPEITQFVRSSELASGLTDTNNIATEDSANPIYLWLDNNTGILYWYCESDIIYLNPDSFNMFSNFSNLKDLNTFSSFDVSTCNDVEAMFMECESITNINGLKNWDTSNITDMSDMLSFCYMLSDLSGLSLWDVSKCEDFMCMFEELPLLTDLTPFSNWRFGDPADCLQCMFYYCEAITSLNGLENWNVNNIDNMESLFCGCTSLNDISALGSWDLSGVTDIYSMFSQCSSLVDITPLSNWNVSTVVYFHNMFFQCTSLVDATCLNGWILGNNASFNRMFLGSGVTNDTKPSWYTDNI